MRNPHIAKTDLRSTRRSANRRGHVDGPRFRLNFEHLEDRRVLANIYWNTDADGFWDVATNWRDEFNISRLPTATDNVFLDRPTGVFVVTHRINSNTIGSLHADRTGFVLSGGSLTITAESELRSHVIVSGGNLDLDGPLTISGTTTWHTGLIDGGTSGLTNTGTLTLTDTGLKRLSGNLINAGTVLHASAASDLVNSNVGTVTNLVGAVYDLQGDMNVATDTFINRGTLRKSGGTGTSFMSPRNFSNERGTIDVRIGRLQIAGPFNVMVGGVSTGGIFAVDSGAVLDLSGLEHTVRYSGNYTGSGAGLVRLQAGVLEVGAAGATFNFPPGLFQWTGGIIAGGATGLTNTGEISLDGNSIKSLSGVLNNAGTVKHIGTGDIQFGNFGNFFSGPAGTFNNRAGGLYDLANDVRLSNGTFNNFGTLRKSSLGFAATDRGIRFNNLGGTIDVRKGTLLLRGTSGAPYPTHTGGNFTVSTGAFLDLTNADGIQVMEGNFTGSGEGMVRFLGIVNTGGAITMGAGGANFDFTPGLLHWMEGVIDARAAPFTNRGTMTVDVNTTVVLNPYVRLRGTLNNLGTLLHLDDGILSIDGENGLGHITNLSGGVYEFRGDGVIQRNGPNATVENFGLWRKASGDGTATINVDSPFNNTGTVEVNSGRLLVRSSVAQIHGATLTGGTWMVGDRGHLDLERHSRVAANRATVVLDGPGSRFPAIEHLLTNAGHFELRGGRSLAIPFSHVARSFATGLSNTYSLAFDPTSGNLFTYRASLTEILEFTPTGGEVLPRIPFPGGGATSVDLDIASEPLIIGGSVVPAGTLLVVNGSAKTLFGIDKNTGVVLASATLPVPFGTVLGGSYHAARGTMFLVDSVTVFEVNPDTGALLQSFPVQPAGSPLYALNAGDLEVDPLTGHLLLASAGKFAIRELTPAGQFVRDQDIQSLNLGPLFGIALDDATRHLWVSNSLGTIAELESHFTNSGNVRLAPGSAVDVPGVFHQQSMGTLTVQVGGDPASGKFGRVITTSPAILDGTLGIELVDGFGPVVGQRYPIMSYSSAVGSYSQFTGLNGGRTPLFAVDQLPTSVVLNAVGSAADLTLAGFVDSTFPVTATPGQSINITYDVRNLNETAAVGEWMDSLYLSRDTVLDESDVLLGRIQHTGGVAGMSTYRETLSAPLPPIAEGSYRVIVLSDSRGTVLEADRTNNVGFSSNSVAVTVPLLPLGANVMGNIAYGQDRYYRLIAAPGKDLKITADFAATGVAATYVRYRDLPDRTIFDEMSSDNERQQRLLIGNPQGGSYYLLIRGTAGAGGGSQFTLRAEAVGFEIVRFSPLRGSNQGMANIEVIGAQFTPQTMLSLHHDFCDIRTAQSVQFIDANRLRAVFDLQGLTPGTFQLRASDPGSPEPAISLDAFTVTDKPPGIVSLLILSPAQVRVGMPISVAITIINGNESPAVAPLLEVKATNVAAGEEDQIVYGEGLDALPGVLPPLYDGEVGVVYRPNPEAHGVVSTFNLTAINPSAEFIDWDGQKESLRPADIPTDAWDAIWANLRPALGHTLADLYTLLQNDARELFRLGHRIQSVSRLFEFELAKANYLPAIPVPAAAVDLSFSAPGLPLLFGRDFGASITQRYRVGRLGRGWVDNFDISLSNDATAGLITIHYGHTARAFSKDQAGVYRAFSGDFASLTEVGGAFQLREKTGEITAFRNDGLLDFLQDTNGNRITADYSNGELTRLVHSNGRTMTLSYNVQRRISQVTDPEGNVAIFAYDSSGQHLQSVTTIDGTTEYSYTPETVGPRAHALASIRFLEGIHLFFEYDSQGRLARQQRDGGAESLTVTYGVASYRVKDDLDNVTTISYDQLGLTKETWDGLYRRIQFGHSRSQNLLTKTIGPDGLFSTITYDDRGNPIQIRDPMGRGQQFEYETSFNNLSRWRDALGRETDYRFDANGNHLSTTFPDGTVEEFSHDAQGNLVRAVNRRGQTIRYTYDVNGLVKSKELPGGILTQFGYDSRGNMVSATSPLGSTVMEYDAADRMTKISYPGGRFLQFAYDAGGRRIRSTDQTGFSVNYRYDLAGRLEELTDDEGHRLVLYQYDAAGRLSSETRGNGTTTRYTYDAADQLMDLTHSAPDNTVLSQFAYTYDDYGRVTSMTTLNGTTAYEYDAADQLVRVAQPDGRIIQYAYDEAGNRREITDNGVATPYTVNELNAYLTVGNTSHEFDADGNLVSTTGPGGPRSYRFDAEGQLLSVVTPEGTWNYEYDVFGNRVATIRNGQRTEYLIDPAGMGNVVAEYDGAGNLLAHYAHGLGLVSRIDAAGPEAYFQFDANGNTAQLTGASGVVLNTYSYLPFGEPVQVSETIPNPFTYSGELGVMRDGNGVDYMRNRWYDPAQGRFIQQDPIGLSGGTNQYAYVGNNPVSLSDPMGLVGNNYTNAKNLVVNGIDPVTGNAVGRGSSAVRTVETAGSGISWGERISDVAHAAGKELYFGRAGTAYRELEAVGAFRWGGRLGRGLGYIGAAIDIAKIVAVGLRWNHGINHLLATKKLPACAVPDGTLQRIYELCDGAPATTGELLLHLLDQIAPFYAAIAETLQTEPSRDPNDISGPAGVGADRFLAERPILPYTILFENIPSAEGPAAQVVVTHQLDDDLDLETFQLGDFGFGDLIVDVPDHRTYYHTRLDLRATRRVFVDATAELDRQTRVVTWTLTALDPATMDIPADPFTGFLPPDKTPPEGQGFVNFSIRPNADSPTGTRIDAQATIVFDTNEPIDTPRWTNTLDLVPPTSSIEPLPATANSARFTVSWGGSDGTGSGITSFDIFVAHNGGPFELWLDDTAQSSAVYSGEPNHRYSFYSVATDAVGHLQATPTGAQASTIAGPHRPGDANRDGHVDADDFAIWDHNKFTSPTNWSTGDFTGDSITDGKDFNIWNINKFTLSSPFESVRPQLRMPRAPLLQDRISGMDTASQNRPPAEMCLKSGTHLSTDAIFSSVDEVPKSQLLPRRNDYRARRRGTAKPIREQTVDIVFGNLPVDDLAMRNRDDRSRHFPTTSEADASATES